MGRGFTLIELLVVVAIIAIIAVVVVLVINPAQLLAAARDSNRLSDMATINSAAGIYASENGSSFGTANVIYVSIPAPAATSTLGDQCQGLGLLSLPAAYTYHCAASSTYRNSAGTGWIPINFSSLPGGSPLGQFPIDPTNTSSSRFYYTYEASGNFYESTMVPEATKYKLTGSNDVVSTDGGTLASVYEKGTELGLEPLDYGDASLIGYWTFEEGSSSAAYDYSGNNATGSWNGTATGSFGYYSMGKIGNYAGAFDGVSTYVADSANSAIYNLTSAVTMVAWVKLNASSTDEKIISKRPSYVLSVYSNNIPETEIFIGGVSKDTRSSGGGTTLQNGVWYQVAGTYDGTTLKTYVDGALDRQLIVGGNMDTDVNALTLGKTADSAGNYFYGLIDDARVYNRALSAAEIAALYAGGK